MNKNYIKELYDDNSGFRLHYTIGEFAGKSTTQYLHYDVELSLIYFSWLYEKSSCEDKWDISLTTLYTKGN